MRTAKIPVRSAAAAALLFGLFVLLGIPSPAAGAETFDVVVVGGTPGGISSAITAARLGRTVALLEYHNHLGGMAASGLGKTDIETPEAIGGLFKEFIARVHKYYVDKYGADSENVRLCRNGYYYEPSVAEKIFNDMVGAESRIRVFRNHRLDRVARSAMRVVSLVATDRASGQSTELEAKMFVDATYEGDLAAFAGARYRLGRESRAEFNELHAGVVYQDPKTRTFLAGTTGEGDRRLQAYTFRLCLTTDPANARRMTVPPPDYDRRRYAAYIDDWKAGRLGSAQPSMQGVTNPVRTGTGTTLRAFTIAPLPNNKTDCNMYPRVLAYPFVELNYGYPEADEKRRTEITTRIRNVTKGLLYFLQNDPELPEEHRKLANQFHFAKDEFTDNGNFPWQLYVREARRIVGMYTLSENDLTLAPGLRRAPIHFDSITAGEYPIDSMPVRGPEKGQDVILEGYLLMLNNITRPYQIPYRIIVPETVDNLLVPVAASTTHVAFSSIRLEPTWMALGQAAAVAAHLAIGSNRQPRQLPAHELQRILLRQKQVLTYFNDLDLDDPAFEAMQFLGARGYFPDYSSRPRDKLSLGEAAHWMGLALKAGGVDVTVNASGVGGAEAGIKTLTMLGILRHPSPGQSFAADAPLSRVELQRWLATAGGVLGAWPVGGAASDGAEAFLNRQGLGVGSYSDPRNPDHGVNSPVLRGEFCRAIYRLLEKSGH